MPAGIRHTLRSLFLTFLLLGSVSAIVSAQDISRYSVTDGGELFRREVDAALLKVPKESASLPRLDCAVEYLRRDSGDEIVYRRGPIDLHMALPLIKEVGALPEGSYPAAAEGVPSNFQGGLLLDLPRAGETLDQLSINPDGQRYMLRVAVIPEQYSGSILRARVILERAIVSERGEKLKVLSSEVFSRPVELEGNLPLKFDLPAWEVFAADGKPLLPASLQEAVLLTLETPRHFSLPPSLPEPFNGRTQISYAVPTTSQVKLSIRIQGEEKVLDEGKREAGTYDVAWNSGNLPDGEYKATLEAKNESGDVLFRDERSLTKSITAENASVSRPEAIAAPQAVATMPSGFRLFSAGIESGISYQFPADAAKGLRNMFTHVAFRAGVRIVSWLEIGIVAGQDAFHEYPGANVDIDQIANYGGVVAWTYGYAGPYVRLIPGSRTLAPFVQFSTVWSDAATAAELAGGLRIAIWPQVEAYFGPAVLAHLRDDISTKIGIHYGMSVRF